MNRRFLLTFALLLPAVAAADGPKLSAFTTAGYLASPGGNGSALAAGVTVDLARHFAVGFDLGYGLIDTNRSAQDRWWLMPTLAGVVQLGRVRVEAGAGLGLGAASGYLSWAAYADAPFMPVWAFQLVPTARAHLSAAMPVTRTLSLFARAELAALLLGGNGIGFRDGNAGAPLTDTSWLNFALGVQFGVL